MSFIYGSFGPLKREFIEAYRKGEIQNGKAWTRWKEEDEIYEHWMCLYDRTAERWNEKPYCRRHPREWEHYWLHPHLEIYLASRGEIAFMIEKSG